MKYIKIVFDEELHIIPLEDDENYRFYDKYPDYLFTDKGKAYSFYLKGFLKPELNKKKNGYLRWFIKNSAGKQVHVFIHRMVWDIFGDKPYVAGNKIHHKDFNRFNNSIDNLMLCENQQEHAAIHNAAGHPFGKRTKDESENMTNYSDMKLYSSNNGVYYAIYVCQLQRNDYANNTAYSAEIEQVCN